MGVTGANVPNFTGKASLSLSDLQALADVVRANMQESSPPPARVRVASAKARPAHDVPGSGVYFSGVLYEKPSSHIVRPGLVEDVGWASGVDRPYIVRGHVLLPLAETADGSGVEGSAVAGGIAGIRYAESAIDAPRILPGGIIELPPGLGVVPDPGQECPLAQWGSSVDKTVPGLIQKLTLESVYEYPACYGGQIYFPLAATVDEYFSERGSAVAGAIAGIRYAESSVDPSAVGSGVDVSAVDAPRILPGGIIELPRPVGDIKGVRDYLGNDLSWSEVAAGAGSQVGVASINLQTAGGDVPLGLAVGFTPAGTLSFALYNATF